MSITAFLLATLLAVPSAQAGSKKAPNGVPWNKVDKRAEDVYTAGWITSLGSMGVSLYGFVLQSAPIMLAGDAVNTGGVGMMAGSTMRQRRSINARGGRVGAGFGYASWGTLGASVVFTAGMYTVPQTVTTDGVTDISPTWAGMYAGSVVTSIAAYLFASQQHNKNARGRNRMGRRGASQPEHKRVEWSLRPVWNESLTGGFVEGRF